MIAKFDKSARTGNGDGLKDYLENGTKNDRKNKDKRVPLYGDLDLLISAIKIGHNKGNKETYRNIVVSFDEDHINENILEDISRQFIQQYTQGYKNDEIVAYAEAHYPKIKYKYSINKNTGEIEKIKRKPHIHISFSMYSPKLNKQLMLNSNDKRIYDIDLLSRKLELEYGLAQVKTNSIQKDLTQIQIASTNLTDRKNIKDKIDAYLHDNIINIDSFTNLKKQLIDNFDIQIIQQSSHKAKTKSITILYENKKIRLKGDIFNDFTFDQAKTAILVLKEKEHYKEITNKPLSYNEIKRLNTIEKKLKTYNLSRAAYIDRNNLYSREQAKKKLKQYSYIEYNKKSRNTISYQAKIYESVYGSNINYDLKGFYIKKYEKHPIPITIVSNKNKHIKVIDRGDEIEADDSNLQEQVKIMIEMAKAKNWDLNNLDISGSNDFKQEVKKQLKNINLKNNDSTLFPIIKTEEKSHSIPKYKNTSSHLNIELSKIDLLKLKKDLNPKDLLEKFDLNTEIYLIDINQKGEYRIKCGNRNYNTIDFMIKEMNYDFKESIEILNNMYKYQQLTKNIPQQDVTPTNITDTNSEKINIQVLNTKYRNSKNR